MIPLIMGALGRVPWRLVGAAGLTLAVALMGWRVSVWKSSHEALPGVQAALEAEEACADGSKCQQRQNALRERQDEFNRQVAINYAQQLDEINARPPAPVVRLCQSARGGAVRLSGTAPAADGAASGGVVPLTAGPDIGGVLYELADDADREALKLKWLQEYNRALSSIPAGTPEK